MGPYLLTYIRGILAHIPLWHWAVMVIMALLVAFLFRKRCSTYGAIFLGLTVFAGLFLIETAVFLRHIGILPHGSGVNFNLSGRIFHGSIYSRAEDISNIAVFVPFGFFLSEFISSRKPFGAGRRIGLVTLVASGFSLCIECLQLILQVGYFELTDLVMNTVGAFVGAGLSLLARAVFARTKSTVL